MQVGAGSDEDDSGSEGCSEEDDSGSEGCSDEDEPQQQQLAGMEWLAQGAADDAPAAYRCARPGWRRRSPPLHPAAPGCLLPRRPEASASPWPAAARRARTSSTAPRSSRWVGGEGVMSLGWLAGWMRGAAASLLL